MWKPEELGWLRSDISGVYYKGLYELRKDRMMPNGWICRKKVREGNIVKILVKFYQYIPENDVDFAKKILNEYLYPSDSDKEL